MGHSRGSRSAALVSLSLLAGCVVGTPPPNRPPQYGGPPAAQPHPLPPPTFGTPPGQPSVLCGPGTVWVMGRCASTSRPPAVNPTSTPAWPAPIPQPAPPTPRFVHIAFTSVLVGPAKSNGCQWDGLTCNAGGTAKAISAVDAALAVTNPYAAAAFVLAGPAASALEKPDPTGVAELYAGGTFQSIALPKRQDTFTPQWTNARWMNVKLEPATRLSVRLQDADLINNDDMAIFEIGFNHLMAALHSQGTYQVPVYMETYKQVLFAEVSVVPAQ